MPNDNKKPETKGCYLGIKIHPSYEAKLLKLQAKNGDEKKSVTARKILYKALDSAK